MKEEENMELKTPLYDAHGKSRREDQYLLEAICCRFQDETV